MVWRLKSDLLNVSKGDVVTRRPSCNEATRSMKTARQDTKRRIARTPVKLSGNQDQKSAGSQYPAASLPNALTGGLLANPKSIVPAHNQRQRRSMHKTSVES
jgi:hypothetical protein